MNLRLRLHSLDLPISVLVFSLSFLLVPSAFGGSATLSWDPNTEPDLLGYNIYFGTSPGVYGSPLNVGNVTTFTVPGLIDGTTYYFAVTAYDSAIPSNESGPSNEVSKTIPSGNTDTTPPTVSITSPSNNSTLSGTVSISATAADANGIASVQFFLDGNPLGAPDNTAPYTVSWDTNTATNAAHTLSAIAQDPSGNTAQSTANTVTVNNTGGTGGGSLISNVSVASGAVYEIVENSLQTGSTVYIDRSYPFTSVPSTLQGSTYIRTANNDKNSTGPSFLTFTLSQPATIYVAHDQRITSKPAWLSTYSDTGTTIVTSDTTLQVFSKNVPAGTVTLGGNQGAGNSMYGVIVKRDIPWQLRDSGDVNFDGKADLIFRHIHTGEVEIWFMDGTTVLQKTRPATAALEWQILGVGDLNADGKADILWRHLPSGLIGTWLMDGPAILQFATLDTLTSDWALQGTGDYNADGKTDILWRHLPTGQIDVWLLDGTTVMQKANPGIAHPEWKIQGTGDLNADGKTDIIWRHLPSGQIATWLMDGPAILQFASPATASPEWQIQGVGDINADGKTDILWCHLPSGQIATWLMDGPAILQFATLDTLTSDWAAQGTGDYNADGKTDIIWRHLSTGQIDVWLMDGTTILEKKSLL